MATMEQSWHMVRLELGRLTLFLTSSQMEEALPPLEVILISIKTLIIIDPKKLNELIHATLSIQLDNAFSSNIEIILASIVQASFQGQLQRYLKRLTRIKTMNTMY